MVVKNNLAVSPTETMRKVSLSGEEASTPIQQPSQTEFVDSKASLAARAYATPQINFQGRYDKILNELRSDKNPKKLELSFQEAANFLERLGFANRPAKGSHNVFTKENTNPITLVIPHGGKKTIDPGAIKTLRDYVVSNNVIAV